MKDLPLLLYPLLLLALTFYGAKFTKKGGIAPEYLSLDQTKMIRASACLGILLHHLTQEVTGYNVVWTWPITVFNHLGFVFTALFFFFSGFGLITNVYSRPEYLRTFPVKRLSSVLIPFWMINLLGIFLNRFVYGLRYTAAKAMSDLSGLTLVNSNGWFIIEIVILYLLFYFLFRLIRKKDLALVLLCAATVVLIRFSFFRGHGGADGKAQWFRGEWWFNSTISFVFGLLYARFRTRIDAFSRKHSTLLLAVFAILSVLTWQEAVYAAARYGYYQSFGTAFWRRAASITLAAQSITCLVCTMLVLLMNMRLTIGNRALKYISRISTELFLIHGYFISRIFAGIRMNGFIRFAAVIACSITCAAVISPCDKWLVGRVCRICLPGKSAAGQEARPAQPHFPFFSKRRSPAHDTLESRIAERARKKRRKILLTAAAATAGVSVFILVYRAAASRREFREECEMIRSANVGDEVFWGRADTDYDHFGREHLSWIVIRREEDAVCLLSKEGLAGSSYHQRHEAVAWEDSDLRALLQSEIFTRLFSKEEKGAMTEKNGDMISLLTVKETAGFFETEEERELVITPAAEANGTNINVLSKDNNWDMKGYRSSWWWLKGEPGKKDIYAPVVTVDGEIRKDEKEVNRPNGAVRPVIWVKIR